MSKEHKERDALTRAISRRYDIFQTSLETLKEPEKFMNFGYTISRRQTYEQRQEQLCLKVFEAAEFQRSDFVVDVGFGSGEQDFLLHRTYEFDRLAGFNISQRQVRYANFRAAEENLSQKLSFRLGEAEVLPEISPSSVDKLLAIECAHYFDRPRFYRRVAEVLKAWRSRYSCRHFAVGSSRVFDEIRGAHPPNRLWSAWDSVDESSRVGKISDH